MWWIDDGNIYIHVELSTNCINLQFKLYGNSAGGSDNQLSFAVNNRCVPVANAV